MIPHRWWVALAGAFLAVIAGCSSDGPTPPPPPTFEPPEDSALVASVEVLGVPSEPLLLGSVLQLVALARDSSGELLPPGYEATWRSSDTTVASISAEGHVTTHAVGLTTISAELESFEDSALLDVRDGGIIRVILGGVMNAENGDVLLTAEHSSVAADMPITMQYTAFPGLDARLLTGTAVDVRPVPLDFLKPVWFAIKWPTPLPAGRAYQDLSLFVWADTAWLELPSDHMASGYVVAYIARTGVYGIGISDGAATPQRLRALVGHSISMPHNVGVTRVIEAARQVPGVLRVEDWLCSCAPYADVRAVAPHVSWPFEVRTPIPVGRLPMRVFRWS